MLLHTGAYIAHIMSGAWALGSLDLQNGKSIHLIFVVQLQHNGVCLAAPFRNHSTMLQ